jgi:hypothetical protein
MHRVDIILQGPISGKTEETAQSYLTWKNIGNVIISSWGPIPCCLVNKGVLEIYSPDLDNPGYNNRNRQIFSTQVGLEFCHSNIVIKTRTDQMISIQSLQLMYDYFLENYKIKDYYNITGNPSGALFLIENYRNFPFHIQDHIIMGWNEDVKKMFSVELDSEGPADKAHCADNTGVYTNFSIRLRPNIYIAKAWYEYFDENIKHMYKNYKEYLVDGAPKYTEALALSSKWQDRVFKTFPRLEVYWEKYGIWYDTAYEWGIPYGSYHS